MTDKLTEGQIKVLKLASVGIVKAKKLGLTRPFGVCIKKGFVRGGVITDLGRQALAAAKAND